MNFNDPLDTAPDASVSTLGKLEHTARKQGYVAVAVAVLLLALYQISQRLPSNQWTILLTTFLSLPITIVFAVAVARSMSNRLTLALCGMVSLFIFLPVSLGRVLIAANPSLLKSPFIPVLRVLVILYGAVPGLGPLLLIVAAAVLGVLVSLLVKEMKILLPMAAVRALMDLWVVFGGGLVHTAVHAPPQKAAVAKTAMRAFSATLPTVKPPARGAEPLAASVGFADFLFISLFFACFSRFDVSEKRILATQIVLVSVLTVYMGLVYALGSDLPALVPISIVIVAMNMKEFRYTRSELFALAYACVFMVLLLGGFWWLGRR